MTSEVSPSAPAKLSLEQKLIQKTAALSEERADAEAAEAQLQLATEALEIARREPRRGQTDGSENADFDQARQSKAKEAAPLGTANQCTEGPNTDAAPQDADGVGDAGDHLVVGRKDLDLAAAVAEEETKQEFSKLWSDLEAERHRRTVAESNAAELLRCIAIAEKADEALVCAAASDVLVETSVKHTQVAAHAWSCGCADG